MKFISASLMLILYFTYSIAQVSDSTQQLFTELNSLPWSAVDRTLNNSDWEKHWTVDGYRADIKETNSGLLFCAGPVAFDNGSHAVMWTKESFSGAIKIEFDYTRVDDISRFVNIIYIQATGIGTEPYAEDIHQWDSLRTVPTMSKYFRNMNAYHISFAAFGVKNDDPDFDYVRARRYPVPPQGNFSKDTALQPDYFRTGLFQPGTRYRMTIIKKDNHLILQVSNNITEKYFYWNTSAFPAIESGKVGIRHMYTRSALYENFTISSLQRER
ncbi:MAG: hypothetical protein AAF992_22160 [Bacteroidota bacterium]